MSKYHYDVTNKQFFLKNRQILKFERFQIVQAGGLQVAKLIDSLISEEIRGYVFPRFKRKIFFNEVKRIIVLDVKNRKTAENLKKKRHFHPNLINSFISFASDRIYSF